MYPSNSRRASFELRQRSSETAKETAPGRNLQARAGSLFTQYSPITLAPIAPIAPIAPPFLLGDNKVDRRRKQSRSMPLPNIPREDSESGSVVVTTAIIERQEEGQSFSTSLIFPPQMAKVENLQNTSPAKGKIRRQRSQTQ